MPKQFYHDLYGDLINTVIALFVIMLTTVITVAIITKKTDSHRRKHRLKVRGSYIAAMIFLFVVARIWVEGFTHLLAVLGLVSAALVVTNKETIMNFVGWLIITWRELFVEDDLVQIQQYKGYVKRIGVLYFTLAEISEVIPNNITGRIIRVPNGLASNNVLINFSQTSHLLEQSLSFTLPSDMSPALKIKAVKKDVDEVIKEFYQDKKEYSLEYLHKRNKYLQNLLTIETYVSFASQAHNAEKPEGVINYYCFLQDAKDLRNLIYLKLCAAA